ncbi:MAG: SCO family protein [Bacteroidota bacterium]
MNKRAFLAILLALFVPLVAYFIVSDLSGSATQMPRHYFPDSVVQRVVKGKQVLDTAWHQVEEPKLINQLGDTVTFDSLRGKILVMDFFFTRCPTICPAMTMNMKRMAESIHNGKRVGDKTNKRVHFISISIDPERDSLERIKHWADRFQVNPEQWWILTGNRDSIYQFVLEEIKLGLIDGEGVDSNFVHSDKFVLVDPSRRVRGYYSGLDSMELKELSNDLVLLTMEKDPNRKFFLSGKLPIIAFAFLAALFGVFLLLFLLKKSR